MAREAMAQKHVAEADTHIEEAEERIARQKALIAELAADGHATMEAEKLLESFIATLDAMHKHKETIQTELDNF
jgi:D-serine dehydratase